MQGDLPDGGAVVWSCSGPAFTECYLLLTFLSPRNYLEITRHLCQFIPDSIFLRAADDVPPGGMFLSDANISNLKTIPVTAAMLDVHFETTVVSIAVLPQALSSDIRLAPNNRR